MEASSVIGVLRSHLEEIHIVLRNSRTREEALDLADALRKGEHAVRPSRIAKVLDQAIQHVEGYLEVSDDVPS